MLQEVPLNSLSVEPVATLSLQVSGSDDGDSNSLSDHDDDALGPESPENVLQVDTLNTACSCP